MIQRRSPIQIQLEALVKARYIRVIQMREEYHWTFERIGRETGVTRSMAHNVYQRAKAVRDNDVQAINLRKLKEKARRTTEGAVAYGQLVREPCEVCGKLKVEGHHPDYNKPLEVIWLCHLHHRRVHAVSKAPQPNTGKNP